MAGPAPRSPGVFGGPGYAALAADFNQMAGELDGLYRDLEHKVEQKSRELARSERLASVGFLAAGVAHEINNPLTAVLTYSSYLMKRSQGRPETQKDLQVIVSETIRCREIVKNLLDFARQTVPKKRKADIEILAGYLAGRSLLDLAFAEQPTIVDLVTLEGFTDEALIANIYGATKYISAQVVPLGLQPLYIVDSDQPVQTSWIKRQ